MMNGRWFPLLKSRQLQPADRSDGENRSTVDVEGYEGKGPFEEDGVIAEQPAAASRNDAMAISCSKPNLKKLF